MQFLGAASLKICSCQMIVPDDATCRVNGSNMRFMARTTPLMQTIKASVSVARERREDGMQCPQYIVTRAYTTDQKGTSSSRASLQRKSMARQNSSCRCNFLSTEYDTISLNEHFKQFALVNLLQWRMYSNKVATGHMMTPNFFFVPLKACDTVMAGTDNSPEKIMAEWGSNAAAPLKITSEPDWSPTPTPMATRGSRRRTHRHGEADSSGSARIGNGCWWYSVAMPCHLPSRKKRGSPYPVLNVLFCLHSWVFSAELLGNYHFCV